MNTLIIAADEVLLDRREDSEKIRNLSIARNSKVEAKGKDRKGIEFFGSGQSLMRAFKIDCKDDYKL